MNNIPAFPRPASEAHMHGMHEPQEGMTLRDYFAAHAMPFCLKNCFTTEGAVDLSYEIADEMMKAREL